MTEYQIRRAYEPDAPAIAHILCEAWKTAYAGIVPDSYLAALSETKRARILVDSLAQFPALRYYVVEQGGVPVGAASLHPSRDEDLRAACEFSFFYFLPEVWRKGCGRLLLDRLRQDAAEAGYPVLICWTLEQNARAVAFYEAMGMRRDGARHTIEIGAPLQAIRFVLPLHP